VLFTQRGVFLLSIVITFDKGILYSDTWQGNFLFLKKSTLFSGETTIIILLEKGMLLNDVWWRVSVSMKNIAITFDKGVLPNDI
jgi:hypothetical protein